VIPTSNGGGVIQNAVVKVIIPPAVKKENLVWYTFSDRSNQAAIADGYVSVNLTARRPSGEIVTSFSAPIEILLPKARLQDGVVAWSADGISWAPIPRLAERALPDGALDGYFVEADETITVFTRHPGEFGIRKQQTSLDLSISKLDIASGSVSRAFATGGTSGDLISYQTTSDPSVCEVSESGLIFGNSVGTCTVYATRGGGAIYMDVSSPAIDAQVVDAVVPKARGVGRLALASQLGVLGVLLAMCVLLVTLGRRRFPK